MKKTSAELKDSIKYFNWWEIIKDCFSVEDLDKKLSQTDIYEVLNLAEVKDLLSANKISLSVDNIKTFYYDFLVTNIKKSLQNAEQTVGISKELLEFNKEVIDLLTKTNLKPNFSMPTIYSEVDKSMQKFMINYFNYIKNIR